tara:strand:- start:199 stop:618 length:420 start_codon:yes stop_codon:yes gene_type:complete
MWTRNQFVENMNYLGDPRTQGPAKKPELILYDEITDEETVVELPVRWEVCDVCEGEGKHVNPAIDCGGLSAHHFEDPDFAEDYKRGAYDVPCNCCGGKRVVEAVNWEALSDGQRKAYEDQLEDEYNSRQENLAELRMGA